MRAVRGRVRHHPSHARVDVPPVQTRENVMPLTIIETILKIVLLAMEGQPPEIRAKLWERHMAFLEQGDAFWERVSKVFDGKK